MEIIILGFVLFIVGVSATIIYDKAKAFQVTSETNRKENIARNAARLATLQASRPTVNTRTIPVKRPLQQKRPLPGPKGLPSMDDGSINPTQTIQDLIDMIEKMKKK